MLAVEVEDTGMGIEASALPRIFDAFEQTDPSITRQFGGLGLGLAISRSLTEALEGTLEARSPGPTRARPSPSGCPQRLAPRTDRPPRRTRTNQPPGRSPSCSSRTTPTA